MARDVKLDPRNIRDLEVAYYRDLRACSGVLLWYSDDYAAMRGMTI